MTELHTIITEDAAMHRAFRKQEPYQTHADDDKILALAGDICRLRDIAAREAELSGSPSTPITHKKTGELTDVTPEMLTQLQEQKPIEYELLRATFAPMMSHTMACLVRHLRVEEGQTWRSLATWLAESGFVRLGRSDLQLAGMAICSLAADQLDELYSEPPWNVFP